MFGLRFVSSVLALSVVLAVATNSEAAVVFSDNFDSEDNSDPLNYNSFTNWTVSEGTVDLIGTGTDWVIPGHGRFVDLDGSSDPPNAGVMTSDSISLSAGTYALSYDLAGSLGGGANSVVIEVTGTSVSQLRTVQQYDPFSTYTELFTLTSSQDVQIVFADQGNDKIGALLDNVVLESVPEPGSLAVFSGLGIMGLVAARRRRKGSRVT